MFQVTEQQIKDWIAEFQAVIDEEGNSIEQRIAWSELHLLRRIIEEVVGWEDPIDDIKATADLIRKDLNL